MMLLEQVRQMLRTKHYSYRTEQCYVTWIERYAFTGRRVRGATQASLAERTSNDF